MEKKKKFSTRYLLILAAVCVFLLVLGLILAPARARINRLNREITAAEQELLAAHRLYQGREAVSALYAKHTAAIMKKEGEDGEKRALSGEIIDIARSSNVSLTDIRAPRVESFDFYEEYGVEVFAEGRMESLTRFLYLIHTSPQLLRTQRISIRPKEKAREFTVRAFVTKMVVLPTAALDDPEGAASR